MRNPLRLVCILSLLCLIGASSQGYGQSRRSQLAGWSKKILAEKGDQINQMLGRDVVIIHSLVANKKPKFAKLPFTQGSTKHDGYFRSRHTLDFDVAFGLNYPYVKKRQMPVEKWLKLIRSYLEPSMLIYNDRKEGQWKVLEGDSLDDDAFASKAPTKSRKVSYKKLRSFLVKLYGFEGIVIDRRGDAILALVLPSALKKGSQATLIKDSEEKRSISSRDKRVDGILQLTDFNKKTSTAIFRMVFRKKSTPIPFGTKLFIQKR